jgi:hypothetical protein
MNAAPIARATMSPTPVPAKIRTLSLRISFLSRVCRSSSTIGSPVVDDADPSVGSTAVVALLETSSSSSSAFPGPVWTTICSTRARRTETIIAASSVSRSAMMNNLFGGTCHAQIANTGHRKRATETYGAEKRSFAMMGKKDSRKDQGSNQLTLLFLAHTVLVRIVRPLLVPGATCLCSCSNSVCTPRVVQRV